MRILIKIFKYLFVLAVVFVLWMEIILRINGAYYTYSEKTQGIYLSYYNLKNIQTYHVWSPNTEINQYRSEFNYPFTTNSLGLREVELTTDKPDSICRLLFLGDSFTEGVGAPYDSSYPRQFGNILKEWNGNIQIINAGISGSDPFYCYKLFNDKLLDYRPDVLFVTVHISDITDYIFRGGMERFMPDCSVRFRKGPWWEEIYRYSHFCRWFVHKVLRYSMSFIKEKDMAHIQNEAREAIVKCLVEFDSLCKKNQVDFLTIVLFSPLDDHSNSMENMDIDRIAHSLDSTDIMNIETRQELEKYFNHENIGQYIWPIDGHYNSKGYEILARAVEESIEKKYPKLLDKLKNGCE